MSRRFLENFSPYFAWMTFVNGTIAVAFWVQLGSRVFTEVWFYAYIILLYAIGTLMHFFFRRGK